MYNWSFKNSLCTNCHFYIISAIYRRRWGKTETTIKRVVWQDGWRSNGCFKERNRCCPCRISVSTLYSPKKQISWSWCNNIDFIDYKSIVNGIILINFTRNELRPITSNAPSRIICWIIHWSLNPYRLGCRYSINRKCNSW
jgi:hypothetical protein